MDRVVKIIFYRTIKEVRKALGLTQKAFAARMGLHHTSACHWEKGQSFPSEKTIDLIVSVCGVRKEFLMYGEGDIFTQSNISNNFIMISSDSYTEPLGKLSGYDIAKHRLKHSMWPISKSINNKYKFKSSDNLLIYIDGENQYAQHAVATAKVDQIIKYNDNEYVFDYEPDNISTSNILVLNYISWFNQPIKLIDLLDMKVITPLNENKRPNLKSSSCRRLTDADYTLILNAAFKQRRTAT